MLAIELHTLHLSEVPAWIRTHNARRVGQGTALVFAPTDADIPAMVIVLTYADPEGDPRGRTGATIAHTWSPYHHQWISAVAPGDCMEETREYQDDPRKTQRLPIITMAELVNGPREDGQ